LFIGSGAGIGDSTAIAFNGFGRLPSGDLFSTSLPFGMDRAHSLSSMSAENNKLGRLLSAASAAGAFQSGKSSLRGASTWKSGGTTYSNADSDDEEQTNPSPPEFEFIQKEPVETASKEKRWLAFSHELKLVGYFLRDGAFVNISNVKDSKWIKKQESLAVDAKDAGQLEHVTKKGGQLLEQIMEIIKLDE
jgi:hypothetical protein